MSLKEVISIIKDGFKDDLKEYECNLREFFKIMGMDKEDIIEECNFLLESKGLYIMYDDGSVDADNSIIEFKQFKKELLK